MRGRARPVPGHKHAAVPAHLTCLARMLSTPTMAATSVGLADQAREQNSSHEEYLAAVLAR